MNKEFVNYNIALELKELGFDEACFGYYLCKNSAFGVELELTTNWIDLLPYDSSSCKAPLYQQAFRWLLDKHNLYGIIIPTVTMDWTFKTMTVAQDMVEVPPYNHVDACDYSSKEEAELACIKKLINLVKNK